MSSETLERFGAISPDVKSELESMLRMYQLDAEELFFKWESYTFKMRHEPDVKLTLDLVRAFKKDVEDQYEKESKNKVKMAMGSGKVPAKTPKAVRVGDGYNLLDDLIPTTPQGRTGARQNGSAKRKLDVTMHDSPLGKTPRHLHDSPGGPDPSPLRGSLSNLSLDGTPFSKRINPGSTLEILNNHLPAPTLPLPTRYDSRVKLTVNMDIKKFKYRPMHQKLTEAAEVFDDKLDEFADAVLEYHNILDDELGNPAASKPESIVAIGRIVSDSLEGKLGPKSIAIESSRRLGGGSRVLLNLERVSHYSFFPGQVVALRGTNASGAYFTVEEVLTPPPLAVPAASTAELRSNVAKLSDGPLSIFVASGPYTTDDNLLFESLDELCKKAAEQKPDVVILAGPFLDTEHPLIASGDFDLETVDTTEGGTLEDLFKERISPKIKMIQDSMIIIVPSVRDAVSKHVAFPQDALLKKPLDLPKNATCLTSPCTFSLNETLISISTADILFHLSRSELNAGQSRNMFERFTAHLVDQRTLYPLFPPPPSTQLPSHSTPASIDVPYLRLADMLSVKPDVLILPSQLGAFAKIVDGVVTLNPGQLSKRGAAGTWINFSIAAPVVGDEEQGKVAHKVHARARAEVVRI